MIKSHENVLRRESLANKLSGMDSNSFWKEIKLLNNSNTPLLTSIEGVTGAEHNAELWKKHFMDLFNCLKYSAGPNLLSVDKSSLNDIVVSAAEIESTIKELDFNRSCGLDGIYSEHLKYSSHHLLVLLSCCITNLFIHGILPDSVISVVLVPIIKDNTGKITSKDNYCPIALASIVSKVLEIILLSQMSDFMLTNPNQFGFKKNHPTDQCVYVLKEIIDTYRRAS